MTEKRPNSDDFVLFEEKYTICKKIPCDVTMSCPDEKLPPSSIFDKCSAKAVRAYWNGKNLRKRSKITK